MTCPDGHECPIGEGCLRSLGLCLKVRTGDPVWVEHARQVAARRLPSLGHQVAGFMSTAAAVLASGLERASDELRETRLATCRACEYYRPEDGRCGGTEGCGCYVEVAAQWKAKECPRGKWPG